MINYLADMPTQKDVQQAHTAYLAAVRGTVDHALCALCDHQGEVVRATVIRTKQTIFICDECDAICFDVRDIGSERCVGFEVYAEQHGFSPLWTELNIQVPEGG